MADLPGQLGTVMNALSGEVQTALSAFIREHAQRATAPAPTAPVDTVQLELKP